MKYFFKSPSVILKELEYGFNGRIQKEEPSLVGGKNMITGVPALPSEPLPYSHPIVEWNIIPRSYDNLDYLGVEFEGLTQEEADSIYMDLGNGITVTMDDLYYMGVDDYQYDVLDTNYHVIIDSMLNIDNSKIIGYETYTSFINQPTIDMRHMNELEYIFLYGKSTENPNTSVNTILLPTRHSIDNWGVGFDLFYYHGVENINIPKWTGVGHYDLNIQYCPNINNITIEEISNCDAITIADTKITSLDLTNVNFNTPATFGNYIWIQRNSTLTNITFNGDNIGNIRNLYLNDNNLSGVDFLSMPNLTNRKDNKIELQNNNWSVDIVNKALTDLNTISVSGYTGRTIIINGTNAAPDNVSGGYDGITAKNDLISKGFNVVTN